MAKYELVMPKMGESIVEATIIKWHKNVGEFIEQDDTLLEIATDKVDSEIPSPVSGKIVELLYKENNVVPIDTIIAIIATEGEETLSKPIITTVEPSEISTEASQETIITEVPYIQFDKEIISSPRENSKSDKFYSPLVRNMAKEENLTLADLDGIEGTGASGRVTKHDLLKFIADKNPINFENLKRESPIVESNTSIVQKTIETPKTNNISGDTEIIEMDRMRKLIADHMVMSKKVAAHVTSFVEADVTNLVQWRDK
ncbi:MAG TPA: E3 binding domain-containing protein, partial [Saprospiraceae bacterium]|nr:E3 binding domain-containing protein [Saprospiraceae bacterium]